MEWLEFLRLIAENQNREETANMQASLDKLWDFTRASSWNSLLIDMAFLGIIVGLVIYGLLLNSRIKKISKIYTNR